MWGPAALALAALLGQTAATEAGTEEADGGAPAELERRGLPAPLDSPPFPSSDWTGPVIGARDTSCYPFERLLKRIVGGAPDGAGLRVYGWVDGSVDASSSIRSNLPTGYDVLPNTVALDQAVLRFERRPDTVQTDRLDWGFRLTNLFGSDYRFTTAQGWFSSQLFGNDDPYGYDLIEAYAQLYVPGLLEGLVISVGRYASPPDGEDSTAPDNYLFSHSLTFTFDPSTFTGVTAQLQLAPAWTIQLGFDAGSDKAPWAAGAQPTAQALVRYVTPSGSDGLWAGLNAIGSGQFKAEHDDLNQAVATWGHRFGRRVHMQTEGYYMWQYDAVVGGSCIQGSCGAPLPGLSWEAAILNLLAVEADDADYLTLRNEAFDDPYGERTGYATWYTSHTLGWAHLFLGGLFELRPELRYDRAYRQGVTPFDDGTRGDQLTAAVDAIARF